MLFMNRYVPVVTSPYWVASKTLIMNCQMENTTHLIDDKLPENHQNCTHCFLNVKGITKESQGHRKLWELRTFRSLTDQLIQVVRNTVESKFDLPPLVYDAYNLI